MHKSNMLLQFVLQIILLIYKIMATSLEPKVGSKCKAFQCLHPQHSSACTSGRTSLMHLMGHPCATHFIMYVAQPNIVSIHRKLQSFALILSKQLQATHYPLHCHQI
ncbi:hypothetical protein XELAEV_18025128mg [Xenopus laevis]|uniref:Secreted protein n=1 Tax=Xenopus laevis TaxID=8355 RepID=A0A974D1M3_XENLA|nr:hypothetical protein XELAEV_18025128mg [Xenopus laevis]